MNALVIASVSLRRMVRDRTSLFFIVVLPVLVILVIGVTVHGDAAVRVAVVDRDHTAASADLVRTLKSSPGLRTVTLRRVDAARTAVRRGERDVTVVVPLGYGARLSAGDRVRLTTLDSAAPGTRQAADAAVAAAVARHAARYQAAAFAAHSSPAGLAATLRLARRLQPDVPALRVRTDVVNASSDILPAGFGYSAPTMLVLFVFVNALAGGAAMIATRGLRIYDRVMAAPVRAAEVVVGEGLAYLALALLQSTLIVLVGLLVFGVTWGNPLAAAVLVLVWALVGTGAGMLSGTVFRTPEQAGAIGPSVGIALGMLGGCMWPLAIVAPVMRVVGHLAPQAWAVDAWTALLSRDGDLAAIAPQLLVLAGVAAALLATASYRFRRSLVG